MEIRQEKEIIDIQVENEEVILSLCADDIILYVENYKKYIKNLLELINEFSRLQDTSAFPHTTINSPKIKLLVRKQYQLQSIKKNKFNQKKC